MKVFIVLNLLLSLICFQRAESAYEFSSTSHDTLNVKDFGAKGNGVTDDYKAVRKVTDLVNKRGGGIIFFPKGTYYLDAHNDSIRSNMGLAFRNCDGVKVLGKKAVISVKGDFHRTEGKKKRAHSEVNQIVPFYFVNCKNISISGLEIDGNVNKMTRDEGVVEKGQGLIMLMGCDDVRITDVYVHHSASDGIYIGPSKKNSTNCTLIEVKSSNNARQGLSITGLRGGYIKKCTFSNTGFTGKYGFHRPAAGVDIEPVRVLGGVKTGDIVFEDCELKNNLGGQLICTGPRLTSNITIRNCSFKGIDSFSRYQIILAADSVLVQNCQIDLGRGILWPTWKAAPGSRVVIRHCTIKSSLQGILSASNNETDSVWILDNKLIFTGDSLTSYFPYLQTRNVYFIDNEIFIPAKNIRNKQVHSLVQNAIESRGNTFYSDKSDIKPRVDYTKTRLVKEQKIERLNKKKTSDKKDEFDKNN